MTELAGNTVLAELAARVERRVRWYCTPVARQRGHQSRREHRELIAAIADHDEQRAATVSRAHAGHTRRTYHERERWTAGSAPRSRWARAGSAPRSRWARQDEPPVTAGPRSTGPR